MTKEKQSAGEESEDGGGGWHKYVSLGKSGRGLSKRKIDVGSDDSITDEGKEKDIGHKLTRHQEPTEFPEVKRSIIISGEESEDGGGNWHQHVSKRNSTDNGNNLSKSAKLNEEYEPITPSESSSSSSSSYGDPKSPKLSKHGQPFSMQKMCGIEHESEDGGGGWHRHVSMRSRNESGNLSKNRLSDFPPDQLSSSVNDWKLQLAASAVNDPNGFMKSIKAHERKKGMMLDLKSNLEQNSVEDSSPCTPKISFEEKKERLHNILFCRSDATPERSEDPVKGSKLITSLRNKARLGCNTILVRVHNSSR